MKYKTYIITALLLLIAYITIGQKTDFSKIDEYTLMASNSRVRNVEDLASKIIKSEYTDLEKARSFYVWIAHNISYDTKAFFTGSIEQYTPNEVLSRKRAVCQGYSTLYKALCDLEEIECEIIPGYSKGYGYDSNKPLGNTDHAWNVVKINNNWYLLDVTWGSGHLNENNKFERNFNEEFFLSKPERFIFKHLPADPMWQLMETPIDFEVFQSDTIKIKEYLSSDKNKFNYRDSINTLMGLGEDEKKLKTALNEFNFNKKQSAQVGYAYMNIAYKKFNDLLNNQDLDPNLAFIKQEDVLEIYETALHYFMLNNDKLSINARKICRNNIKSCKDNLKVYKQRIEYQNR